MIWICSLCGKSFLEKDTEEHHFIPKKEVIEILNLDINADLYRVKLCDECHQKICKEWDKVLKAIKQLQKFPDEYIEKEYGEDVWNWLSLLSTGHSLEHDIENCKECNRPMEQLHIKQLIENGIDEGKRHISRYKIMINLKRKNFSDEEIKEKILVFNRNCNPPENEKVVEYHIKNTLKRLSDGI